MKRALATLAVATATVLGTMACATPDATAHTEPVSIQSPVLDVTSTNTIQEDDPQWDCLTMGNRTCGANAIERTEAWGAFRTDALTPTVLDGAFRVTYRGIALDDGLAGGALQIPSAVSPGKVHVFDVEVIN